MSKSAKNKKVECPTCHKLSSDEGHLCVPRSLSREKCDWCGAVIPNARHLCDTKLREITYICNSCGRTAVKAEHLCQPKRIK